MKNLFVSRLAPAAAALLFTFPFVFCAANGSATNAAPPPAKKAATKKVTKKPVAKKAARRKKPTRLAPKPLPKPSPKPSPRLVIPALKVVPVPAPAPRPLPAPVPAPLPPVQNLTPAQMNVPLPVGGGTLTLVKVDTTDGSMPNLFGPVLPDSGTHYVVFTMRIKNETEAPISWSLDTFNPQLRVAGSEGQPLRGIALLTAKNDKFEKQPINAGEEKTLRFHFQVPLNASLQSLTLGAAGGSTYQFDVSGGPTKP